MKMIVEQNHCIDPKRHVLSAFANGIGEKMLGYPSKESGRDVPL
jgi:hypothetical protein